MKENLEMHWQAFPNFLKIKVVHKRLFCQSSKSWCQRNAPSSVYIAFEEKWACLSGEISEYFMPNGYGFKSSVYLAWRTRAISQSLQRKQIKYIMMTYYFVLWKHFAAIATATLVLLCVFIISDPLSLSWRTAETRISAFLCRHIIVPLCVCVRTSSTWNILFNTIGNHLAKKW